MDAAGDVAQLLERRRDLAAAPASSRAARSGSSREPRLEQARARARARPAAAGRRRAGCARAAGAPAGRPRSPARASPAAPRAAPAARPAGAPFSSAIAAAAPTASSSSGSSSSAGSWTSAATCSPSRSISVVAALVARRGSVDGPAVEVGPGPELRQPVGELSDGSRSAARARRAGRPARVRAQLDEQVADRRAGEARVEQPEEERDRREPDHEERHPLDSLEARPVEGRDR